MAGRLTDDAENPLPVTAIELTVTAAVPLEVSVTVCVVKWSTTSAPNETVVAFTLKDGVAAFSCSETDFDVLPLVAVRVADWVLVTAEILAVNTADVAVAGTVMEVGVVTEALLLASVTLTPALGALPESVTVHESASDPVIDVLPHVNPLTVGVTVVPVPLKLTDTLGALLAIASCPVTEPAADGLNWTDRTSACPGFSVAGRLPPDTENPAPEIESELIVTATLPLEVNVTDLVTAVPTDTLPNASDVVLRLIAGTAAFRVSATLLDEAFAVAVSVAVCAVVTDDICAGNEAEEEPAVIVMLVGIDTALVLLASATLVPPDCAALLSETVQVVVPAPVNVLLPHVNEEREGATIAPDALSLMEVFLDVDPCVAVSVTVCEALTAATVAANGALIDPEATVTEAGTAIAVLLLARLTVSPVLGAAADNVTVQLSVPAPVMEVFAQLRADRVAVPVPLP